MTAPGFSQAGPFKEAFTAIITTAIADPTVLVSFGHPGMSDADDIIGVGKVVSDQKQATVSPNRSREETIELTVCISIYRGGGIEQEQIASDRAYALLGLIEKYVRLTDTTVGGTVRDCFLTSHESDGSTDKDLLAQGRLIEVTAVFTARVRINSSY